MSGLTDNRDRRFHTIDTIPLASIVITSFNRKNDVLRAVASCYAQVGVDLEVLVFDDASTDQTVEALREQWPQCRVFASEVQTGYIVNRNRGFAEARGEIVFSLDDDAYFSRVDIAAKICECFADKDIGAVAIPYIEPLNRRSESSLKHAFRESAGADLRSYVGCAHAVRRRMALELGGYREFFIHQKEEGDFCLRLWNRGWRVIYGSSAPVVHLVKRKAADKKVLFFAGRNLILTEILNAPMPEALFRAAFSSLNFLRYRPSLGAPATRVKALFAGVVDAVRFWRFRNAVDRTVFKKVTRLKGHGPETFDGEVPPPCE